MSDETVRTTDTMLAAVDRLASALVDGICTKVEQAELESLLLKHAEARDRFRTLMHAESILAWKFTSPGREVLPVREGVGECTAPPAAPSGRRRWPAGAVGAIVVITVAAAAGAWLVPRSPPRVVLPETAAAPIMARVIAAPDAQWADGMQVNVGGPVPSGPLRLVGGQAQITFTSGAIVTLHAPTELEVLSAERLFLRHGRITPFVPPEAHGFTVVSPSGEVVDLGTEFTIGVDAVGRTEVFVIDGEVDVTSGHGRQQGVRMTQGYGSRLAAGVPVPVTIQRPIVIDHFTGPDETLHRLEMDTEFPSRVVGGGLELPIAAPAGRQHPMTQVALDHDFSALVGRQSSISFKVTLPEAGMTTTNRAVCLVIDEGAGAPPMAWEPAAAAAVLVSPEWQVGVRVKGEPIRQAYVFSRGEDAVGPYQVVISIDDTPSTRAARGATTWSVMVNGNEIVRDCPFRFADRPRLQLQSFAPPYSGCDGVAIVDDLSVSVADDPSAVVP